MPSPCTAVCPSYCVHVYYVHYVCMCCVYVLCVCAVCVCVCVCVCTCLSKTAPFIEYPYPSCCLKTAVFTAARPCLLRALPVYPCPSCCLKTAVFTAARPCLLRALPVDHIRQDVGAARLAVAETAILPTPPHRLY